MRLDLRVLPALLVTALSFFPQSARAAAIPRLVADLAPGHGGLNATGIGGLTVRGARVFFNLSQAGYAGVSDGTALGTFLLCENYCQVDWAAAVEWRGIVFAPSNNSLVRTDGTAEGTLFLPVQDASQLAVTATGVLVGGCRSSGCTPLVRTDGTAAGTTVLDPGGAAQLQSLNSTTAVFSTSGKLASTDGTAGGTRTLRTFLSVQSLASAGGRGFFLAQSPDDPQMQLWVTDGTVTGTRKLTAFASPTFAYNTSLVAVGSRIFFVTTDSHASILWASDGSQSGTKPWAKFSNPDAFPAVSAPGPFEMAGSRVVFFANDGQRRLWSADGVSLTALANGYGTRLAHSGKTVYALVSDALHGTELWSTDGTVAGTHIRDTCQGSCSGAGLLVQGNGSVLATQSKGGPPNIIKTDLWQFRDGQAPKRLTDLPREKFLQEAVQLGPRFMLLLSGELWLSDGSANSNGTQRVADFARHPNGSNPSSISSFEGGVVFDACSGGTDSGPCGVWRAQPGQAPTMVANGGFDSAVALGKVFYFQTDEEQNDELAVSDGHGPGVLLTHGGNFTTFGGFPRPQGLLFDLDFELWRSDGTVPGTFSLAPLAERPHDFVSGPGSTTLFTDSEALWITDFTPAGTHVVDEANLPNYVQDVAWSGNRAFVLLNNADGDFDLELWRWDGSGPAVFLATFGDARSGNLTPYKGGVAFFEGKQLMFSDGTVAGTVPLLTSPQLAPPSDASEPGAWPTVVGDRLCFPGWDSLHGGELWCSDGTAAGTSLVKDIHRGPASSGISEMVAVGEQVFFYAADGIHGYELWVSNGTAAGTRLVMDLRPGPQGSPNSPVVHSGDNLYFAADDGLVGSELWSLSLSEQACAPSDAGLCLLNGRYQVTAEWTDFSGNDGQGHAVPLTTDTGYLWFFDPSNVEVAVKALDGTALNQHNWVFYGALSNVEYYVTVADSLTGATKRYYNPPGVFASVGDTRAFSQTAAARFQQTSRPTEEIAPSSLPWASAAPCVQSGARLCLNDGRFAVEATWLDFQGHAGTGTAVPLSGDTGYFWFFGPQNVEVVSKVLDGRAVNDKFWFFYGALSNVDYTLTVTDTVTGESKAYHNPLGHFGSNGDTSAF